MKRYVFSLEKVLAYRRLREEQQWRQLAQAYRRRRQNEDILAACRQEMAREQNGKTVGSLDLEEWCHREACLQALAERIRRQQEKLALLALEVKELEQRALQASQEREMLDRLKSRQMAAAQYEEGRREQRTIDELAVARYGYGEQGR